MKDLTPEERAYLNRRRLERAQRHDANEQAASNLVILIIVVILIAAILSKIT